MLGCLDFAPQRVVPRNGKIRDDLVVTACGTKSGFILHGDQSVAHASIKVLAELIVTVMGCEDRPPTFWNGIQCGHVRPVGQVSQGASAILAAHIFKIQKLAAALATEQFHAVPLRILPKHV